MVVDHRRRCCVILASMHEERNIYISNVQFEESKVGVAVICLVGALLCNVFLEYRGRLWVVAVEAVQDVVDVFRPLGRIIEGDTHDCVMW